MKKLALILALWLAMLSGLSPAAFPQAKSESSSTASFVLPASLVEIQEGAFESTAVETIVLPPSLREIGERAFADNAQLRTVSIPASVVLIGDQAFEGAEELTILAEADSYAAAWAREHNLALAEARTANSLFEELGKLLQGLVLFGLFQCVLPVEGLAGLSRARDTWRSLRPQDRPELYPIDYRFP